MANIYKRGDIYWYQIRFDGLRYRGSTKTDNKKLAQQIANTIEADLVRKKFSMPVKSNYIFLTAWEQYINSLSVNNKTKELRIYLSKHFLPDFKGKQISDITQSDIKKYQLKRKIEIMAMPKNIGKKESGISFRSVNLEVNTLSHFFNFCIEKGLIEKNPALGVKKLNELSRLKTLSDSDIEKLIAGATNKLTRNIMTFLIYTGCRKGEALNLKWDDVDMQNDVIAIKGTKTKYDRYIPISKPLKELLGGIEKYQDCLYVFNKNGAKLGDFKKSFHTACKNAGFKDMHIHDLRHVFASKMVKDGVSLYITGELLGHRTTQMTKRYSHLVPDTLKKAVDDVWNKDDKKG
ncbi:MAG: site-specific integrase [Deltaproteobacteria bacterium]|jgi:integrase|nr:site-specific integrase [Deltaproteobacteria bacterium]